MSETIKERCIMCMGEYPVEEMELEHPESGGYLIWICSGCSERWHNPPSLPSTAPQRARGGHTMSKPRTEHEIEIDKIHDAQLAEKDAKIERLLKDKRGANGNGNSHPPEAKK